MLLAPTLALVLSTSTAEAGKLAEGFRGIPFGDAAALTEPPIETGCSPATEPTIAWECVTEIAGVPVIASYMVEEGYYAGILIQTADASTFSEAERLFETYRAAWGAGRKYKDYQTQSLPDWIWTDGAVMAQWTYMAHTNLAQVVIFDLGIHKQIKAAKAVKALEGVGDL